MLLQPHAGCRLHNVPGWHSLPAALRSAPWASFQQWHALPEKPLTSHSPLGQILSARQLSSRLPPAATAPSADAVTASTPEPLPFEHAKTTQPPLAETLQRVRTACGLALPPGHEVCQSGTGCYLGVDVKWRKCVQASGAFHEVQICCTHFWHETAAVRMGCKWQGAASYGKRPPCVRSHAVAAHDLMVFTVPSTHRWPGMLCLSDMRQCAGVPFAAPLAPQRL